MGGYQYFFSIATLFTEEVAAASFWHSPSSLSFFCSGQFLLFLTEFLIIKLLTTIGHWVTAKPSQVAMQLQRGKSHVQLWKKRAADSGFQLNKTTKNTKATKQRQHQRVQVLPLNFKATSTNYTLTKFFLLSAWFRDAISSLRFVFIFISPIDPI